MKFLNVLCASLAVCLQVSTASAQTPISMMPNQNQGSGVTVDQLQAICSLLPAGLADACFEGTSSASDEDAMDESNEMLVDLCSKINHQHYRQQCRARLNQGFYAKEALAVCSNMSNLEYQMQCIDAVRNNNYHFGALRVCDSISNDYTKVECVKSIANNFYQYNALELCRNISNFTYQMTCLKNIQNKEFKSYEVRSCVNENNDYTLANCLSGMGRVLRYQDAINNGYTGDTYQGDAYVDSGNGQYEDRNQSSNQGGGGTCVLKNSNGTVISEARVPVSLFLEAVQDFAGSIGKCVTAEIKGIKKSSAVFNAGGEVVASGLSQDDAAYVARELRERTGVKQCTRVECH